MVQYHNTHPQHWWTPTISSIPSLTPTTTFTQKTSNASGIYFITAKDPHEPLIFAQSFKKWFEPWVNGESGQKDVQVTLFLKQKEWYGRAAQYMTLPHTHRVQQRVGPCRGKNSDVKLLTTKVINNIFRYRRNQDLWNTNF